MGRLLSRDGIASWRQRLRATVRKGHCGTSTGDAPQRLHTPYLNNPEPYRTRARSPTRRSTSNCGRVGPKKISATNAKLHDSWKTPHSGQVVRALVFVRFPLGDSLPLALLSHPLCAPCPSRARAPKAYAATSVGCYCSERENCAGVKRGARSAERGARQFPANCNPPGGCSLLRPSLQPLYRHLKHG